MDEDEQCMINTRQDKIFMERLKNLIICLVKNTVDCSKLIEALIREEVN